MDSFKAVLVLTLFLLWTGLLVLPQTAMLAFARKSKFFYSIPRIWHKGVCRMFGIRIKTAGTPVTDRQTIFVANHVSYLDIPVLSSLIETSFVAKAEVAGWPVFGFLSKLQQTAFISRQRSEAANSKNILTDILGEGKNLVIFPEGTSSNGSSVLPFKSSLFSVALESGITPPAIQPVTVEILEIDGAPVAANAQRDVYAWHGDMDLVPHLWQLAKHKGATIRIHFHTPIAQRDFSDRKELARLCHEAVSSAIQTGLAKAA